MLVEISIYIAQRPSSFFNVVRSSVSVRYIRQMRMCLKEAVKFNIDHVRSLKQDLPYSGVYI